MADSRLTGVDPIIAEARERWTQCDEAEDRQRKSILEAKQFRAGDQWPAAIKIAREGSTAIQGQAAQPPRPCLTVDRLSPAVRQVSNTIKGANFMISVLPNGFGADDETADLFKGYLRRVQVNARDESPVEWAADGAAEGGLGWFRLRSDYVDPSGTIDPNDPASVFDQELTLDRIPNSLSVYCDPHAYKPTKSDAQFMFVTEDLSREEFERRWPDADVRSLDDFMSTGDPLVNKGWVSKNTVRTAEYWRVVYTERLVTMLEDGSFVEKPPTGAAIKKQRLVKAPKVEGYKISACEVLEPLNWLGTRIPLIPVLGEELNVDGDQVVRGIIQEGMDAQRMVNYTYSGAVEIFALGSKSPYIAEEQQIAPYQQIWQTANTANYSYLPYKAVPNAPPPQRQTAEAPIQAAVELMVKSEDAIKATTSIFDPSLGNVNPTQRSGRAIQSLQAQSDLGTSGYPNNVMRALVYAGELMVELIPKITRPGQLLHILGQDDKPDQKLIGQHFVPHDGQAVPTNPQGMPLGQPPPGFPPPDQVQGLVQFYDPTKGRYAVTVNIGKSSATKREEGAAAMGELIPHLPPAMAAVATPEYVEQLSFDGAHQIAEKLRKVLPPQLQDSGDQGPLPPQVQAMLAQLQQENAQLKQILQTKGVEQQAKIQQTQIQEQADNLRAEHDGQIQIQKAEIAANAQIAVAEVKSQNSDLDRRLKLIELFLTAQQEARLDKEANIHERTMHALDHGHEAAKTAADHAHELLMAKQAHEQALEQGSQHPSISDE